MDPSCDSRALSVDERVRTRPRPPPRQKTAARAGRIPGNLLPARGREGRPSLPASRDPQRPHPPSRGAAGYPASPRSRPQTSLTRAFAKQRDPGRKPAARPLGGPHPTRCSQETRRKVPGGAEGPRPGRGCQFWKKETGSQPSEQRSGPSLTPRAHGPLPPACALSPAGRSTRSDASWGFPSSCSAVTTAPVLALATDTPRPLLGDQGRAGAPPPSRQSGRDRGVLGNVPPSPQTQPRPTAPPPAREPEKASRLGSQRGSSPRARAQAGTTATSFRSTLCFLVCHFGGEIPAPAGRRRPASGPVPAWPTLASQAILTQKPFWPSARCVRSELSSLGFHIRFSRLSFSWLLLHGGQLGFRLRIRQKI